jgi:hypothetical protein
MAERLSVGEVRVAPPAEAPGLPAEVVALGKRVRVAGWSIALGASEPARLHAAAPHGVTLPERMEAKSAIGFAVTEAAREHMRRRDTPFDQRSHAHNAHHEHLWPTSRRCGQVRLPGADLGAPDGAAGLHRHRLGQVA